MTDTAPDPIPDDDAWTICPVCRAIVASALIHASWHEGVSDA
jgi:hypothetical protein